MNYLIKLFALAFLLGGTSVVAKDICIELKTKELCTSNEDCLWSHQGCEQVISGQHFCRFRRTYKSCIQHGCAWDDWGHFCYDYDR